MFCRSSKMFLCVIAFVATVVWANSTSADIVATYAGPHTFDHATLESVPLSDETVDVGAQGTVDFTFHATALAASEVYTLWYMGNPNASPQTGEAKLQLRGGRDLAVSVWQNGYVLTYVSVPFSDTTSSHTLSFTWQNGSDSLLTLDGVTTHFTNAKSLYSYTSDTNVVGANKDPSLNNGFSGTIQDVVLYNTYNVPIPEPGTIVLSITGLIGLLCYAWRKRR